MNVSKTSGHSTFWFVKYSNYPWKSIHDFLDFSIQIFTIKVDLCGNFHKFYKTQQLWTFTLSSILYYSNHSELSQSFGEPSLVQNVYFKTTMSEQFFFKFTYFKWRVSRSFFFSLRIYLVDFDQLLFLFPLNQTKLLPSWIKKNHSHTNSPRKKSENMLTSTIDLWLSTILLFSQ